MTGTHKDDVKWKNESPEGLSQQMISENRITEKTSSPQAGAW